MRNEAMRGMFLWGVALLATLSARAVEQRTDFTAGIGMEGWTIAGGTYDSPTYSNAVDRISLSYASSAASDVATVYATANGGAESQIATLSAASSAATLDFPDTTDFRVFRITTAGDMGLLTFSAVVSESQLDSPSGIVVSNNVTGTSFDASWNAVEGAVGYSVYVWTNAVVGASEGSTLWSETFANAPAKTSSVNFKDEFTDNGTSGWTFEKAYASISNGAVRIGTTSDKGVLVSPELPTLSGAPFTLRITAWRQSTSDGTDMPVGVVSGGVTNIAGVICLGDLSKAYHVELPSLGVGDRIALFSPTNKSSARVVVDDVAIVSGYSEGHEEPSYIVDGLDVGNVAWCTLTGLPSEPVSFAVVASGRRGTVSGQSDAVMVDLANPDKVALLNAGPLSTLIGNVYSQDFDSLAYVTSTTSGSEWKNGTTLPFWQAFQNDSAVDIVSLYKGGNATGAKFLVLATNENDTVRALGARVNKDTAMGWGVAFTNETGSTISLTNVSYSAQQWGFANTTNQLLSCEYLVTNRLDWIVNFSEGWQPGAETEARVFDAGTYVLPESTVVNYVPAEPIRIAPGEVLYLKWTFHPPAKGSSALMAIDDLTVGFDVPQRGFLMRLVKHQAQSVVP